MWNADRGAEKSPPRHRLSLSAVLAIVGVAISSVHMPALAAGDSEAGRDLARRWCSGCHIVDSSATGSDAAPAFAAIARRHGKDHGWVKAWLGAPHPSMPRLNLSRQETDDLIAYLESLSAP